MVFGYFLFLERKQIIYVTTNIIQYTGEWIVAYSNRNNTKLSIVLYTIFLA